MDGMTKNLLYDLNEHNKQLCIKLLNIHKRIAKIRKMADIYATKGYQDRANGLDQACDIIEGSQTIEKTS